MMMAGVPAKKANFCAAWFPILFTFICCSTTAKNMFCYLEVLSSKPGLSSAFFFSKGVKIMSLILPPFSLFHIPDGHIPISLKVRFLENQSQIPRIQFPRNISTNYLEMTASRWSKRKANIQIDRKSDSPKCVRVWALTRAVFKSGDEPLGIKQKLFKASSSQLWDRECEPILSQEMSQVIKIHFKSSQLVASLFWVGRRAFLSLVIKLIQLCTQANSAVCTHLN